MWHSNYKVYVPNLLIVPGLFRRPCLVQGIWVSRFGIWPFCPAELAFFAVSFQCLRFRENLVVGTFGSAGKSKTTRKISRPSLGWAPAFGKGPHFPETLFLLDKLVEATPNGRTLGD